MRLFAIVKTGTETPKTNSRGEVLLSPTHEAAMRRLREEYASRGLYEVQAVEVWTAQD